MKYVINCSKVLYGSLATSWGAFWICFFWALLLGIAFQLYVYPTHFKHTYWGHGLVEGDWVFFHQKAIEFAQKSREGHFDFMLVPMELFPVYSLGLVYYITNIYEPFVYLPINALIHGLSGYILFLILKELNFTNRVILMPILLYCCFPTAIPMYTQVHRDGPVFLAYFLFILFLIRYFYDASNARNCLLLIISTILMVAFRPYLLNFYFLIFIGLSIFFLFYKKSKFYYKSIGLIFFGFFSFYLGQNIGHLGEHDSQDINHRIDNNIYLASGKLCPPPQNNFDRIFPGVITRQMCAIQHVRHRTVVSFPLGEAYSNMNAYTDLRVDTPTRFVLAIPVILKIAFVEPIIFYINYESRWTLFGYFSFVETLINLSLLFVLIYFIKQKKNYVLLLPFLCSIVFLFIIAAASVNMSTLYRVKYGYTMLITVIGAACLMKLLEKNHKCVSIDRN